MAQKEQRTVPHTNIQYQEELIGRDANRFQQRMMEGLRGLGTYVYGIEDYITLQSTKERIFKTVDADMSVAFDASSNAIAAQIALENPEVIERGIAVLNTLDQFLAEKREQQAKAQANGKPKQDRKKQVLQIVDRVMSAGQQEVLAASEKQALDNPLIYLRKTIPHVSPAILMARRAASVKPQLEEEVNMARGAYQEKNPRAGELVLPLQMVLEAVVQNEKAKRGGNRELQVNQGGTSQVVFEDNQEREMTSVERIYEPFKEKTEGLTEESEVPVEMFEEVDFVLTELSALIDVNIVTVLKQIPNGLASFGYVADRVSRLRPKYIGIVKAERALVLAEMTQAAATAYVVEALVPYRELAYAMDEARETIRQARRESAIATARTQLKQYKDEVILLRSIQQLTSLRAIQNERGKADIFLKRALKRAQDLRI